MSETVVIDRRFRGPPDSANGGYACAVAARGIAGPAEVTLRAPPPLDTPLRLERRDGHNLLLDGETVLAEARPGRVEAEVPDPVGVREASAAAEPHREQHHYPMCFVCGPDRAPGDGLNVFAGPVAGRPLYAAPWTPGADVAAPDGNVAEEFVWAALDCPSGLVIDLFGDVGRYLLGRLTADIRRRPAPGETVVLQAWTIARDGRKLHTASAMFGDGGDLAAVARALWIELRT